MKSIFVAVNSKYIHMALAPWYLKASCGDIPCETKVMEFTINDKMDAVLERIIRERASIVAFSCYIWNIDFILKLAANIRKIQPETIIILGGPEVSYDAEDVLRNHSFIDFVLTGEGEGSIGKLIGSLCTGSAVQENPDNIGNPDNINDSDSIDDPDKNSGFRSFAETNNWFNDNTEYGSIANTGYRLFVNKGYALSEVPGLVYRDSDKTIHNEPAFIHELDEINSPYTEEMLAAIGSRITYFESSRGCPFSCSYCLSSTTSGVRYFSMERVRSDLLKLANSGVKQIKFVDRTFNCNKKRAAEIFSFIITNFTDEKGRAKLNFHFEAAADLFDDELINLLAEAPDGLIQFEIGVQTVNPVTLSSINRKTDLDKLFKYFCSLRLKGNIHLHLDLIAGLPMENYSSFKESFNRVYAARPHQLQLGFLKLLKGSEIRRRKDEYGIVFRDYPPYEILYNKYISYDELTELKGVEDLVDRFYNSGRFEKTLGYLYRNIFDDAFDMYKKLYDYYIEKNLLYKQISMKELYFVLYSFAQSIAGDAGLECIGQLLKLDFLASDSSGSLPVFLKSPDHSAFREKCFDFLRSVANIMKYLPQYADMPAKQIIKHVHFEQFDIDIIYPEERRKTVVLFDYGNKHNVTGRYSYYIIEL